MRRLLSISLLSLVATLLACGGSTLRPAMAPSAQGDSAAIHAISREFSAAYVRGDIDAMVAAYTPDAVIFPERSEMIAGHEAIRRYWALAPGARVTHHAATPTSIRVEGNTAYDYGVYEIAGERNGQAWGPSRGKYVIVWRREPGGPWRMQLDIWNSRPQPAAQ